MSFTQSITDECRRINAIEESIHRKIAVVGECIAIRKAKLLDIPEKYGKARARCRKAIANHTKELTELNKELTALTKELNTMTKKVSDLPGKINKQITKAGCVQSQELVQTTKDKCFGNDGYVQTAKELVININAEYDRYVKEHAKNERDRARIERDRAELLANT